MHNIASPNFMRFIHKFETSNSAELAFSEIAITVFLPDIRLLYTYLAHVNANACPTNSEEDKPGQAFPSLSLSL